MYLTPTLSTQQTFACDFARSHKCILHIHANTSICRRATCLQRLFCVFFVFSFFAALPDGRATQGFSLFVCLCLQNHSMCCECVFARACVCMYVCARAADTLTQYSVKREALVEGNMANQLSIMLHAHTLPHTYKTAHSLALIYSSLRIDSYTVRGAVLRSRQGSQHYLEYVWVHTSFLIHMFLLVLIFAVLNFTISGVIYLSWTDIWYFPRIFKIKKLNKQVIHVKSTGNYWDFHIMSNYKY